MSELTFLNPLVKFRADAPSLFTSQVDGHIRSVVRKNAAALRIFIPDDARYDVLGNWYWMSEQSSRAIRLHYDENAPKSMFVACHTIRQIFPKISSGSTNTNTGQPRRLNHHSQRLTWKQEMNPGICYPPVKNYDIDYGAGGGPTQRQYVKYVPVGFVTTHSVMVGYLLWLVGFTGAHRFYMGRPLTGLLWALTFGLFGIGWIVDAFLIPSMAKDADQRYLYGNLDYNLAWVFFVFFGMFGVHRFYQMKIVTGILYLLTGGFFFIGLVYDAFTLNDQISESNWKQQNRYGF